MYRFQLKVGVVVVAIALCASCTALDCEEAYTEIDALGVEHSEGPNGSCLTTDDCETRNVTIECEGNGTRIRGCPTGVHRNSAAEYDADMESLRDDYCAYSTGCLAAAACDDEVLQCIEGRCVYR